MKNLSSIIIATVLGIIFLLLLTSFQVRVAERALVTTFGRPTREITEPGLYWKMPLPIQRVIKLDSRLHVFEDKLDQVQTLDNKTLLVATYVGWNVEDPRKFVETLGSLQKAEAKLEGWVRHAKNGVISQHRFAELINTDPARQRTVQIEEEVLQKVRQSAERDNAYGIRVTTLGFKQLGIPESITAKVFDRMREERAKYATAYRAEGDSEATIIKSRARSQADQMIAKAQYQAEEIKAQGDAEAAKYYSTFTVNEELAIFLRKLKTIEALQNRSTIFLDTQIPPFDLFNDVNVLTNRPAVDSNTAYVKP